ncbi:MAG: hypothetical protein IJP65_07020 [Bacteroidales bacterium]|nr:hypothetical protein [Bacteroidales bacterium]
MVYNAADNYMKKIIMIVLTAVAISLTPIFANQVSSSTLVKTEPYHDKGQGIMCFGDCGSLVGCTVYPDEGYVITDGDEQKCSLFRINGGTYNAGFKYCDCTYGLLIPWW